MGRGFGGINNSNLYNHTKIGTKSLIEEFNNEIIECIKVVAAKIDPNIDPVHLKEKMEFFKDLRQSLGNTALLLSGGAALGMYHIGVLKALYETGLLPRIITGASSGSIMAS